MAENIPPTNNNDTAVYPIGVTWTISKKAILKAVEINSCLQSKQYRLENQPSINYSVMLWPNGDREEERGVVWIFLDIKIGPHKSVHGRFNFNAKYAELYKRNFEHVWVDSHTWGQDYCDLVDFLNPEMLFLIDDDFILNVTGTLTIEKKNEFKIPILTNLKSRNGKDFTIKIGDQQIMAHKNILAANFPTFGALLEAGHETGNSVTFTGYDYEIIEAAILFCYGEHAFENLSIEQVLSLFKFANHYAMIELKSKLEIYLIPQISTPNVCAIANTSISSDSPVLEKKCYHFLINALRKGLPVHNPDSLNVVFAREILREAFTHHCQTT